MQKSKTPLFFPSWLHKAVRWKTFSHMQWPSPELPRVRMELVMGTAAVLRNNGLTVCVFWRHRARSREEGRKTRRRRSRHHSKITAKPSASAEVQASQKTSQTLSLYSFLSPKEVVSITHCAALLELATGIWARNQI